MMVTQEHQSSGDSLLLGAFKQRTSPLAAPWRLLWTNNTLMASLTELQLSKVATADLLANSEVWSNHKDPRGRGGAGGPRVPAAPLGHFTAPDRPLALLLSGVIHDCGAGGTEIQMNQAGAQSRQLRPKENSWDDCCWHRCRWISHCCQHTERRKHTIWVCYKHHYTSKTITECKKYIASFYKVKHHEIKTFARNSGQLT